jgi:predicted TIM-barrel fold metal-dependent hydrolase
MRHAGLQSVADKHGFPHGIVCEAVMTDPDLDAKLKTQKQFPNLRGVREQIFWDSHPLRQRVSRPDYCNMPDFHRGFALLEKYGLSFELQVFAGQAKYAVDLIRAFPNVPMILLHSGMLTDRSLLMIEQWRGALATMAAFPNVHVKLSGLGMFSLGLKYTQARQVIRDSIQIFGIDRTIFGSNFPLEKLHASYAEFIAIYRKVMSEYSEADQRKVFHDNAVKFYRL